MYHGADKVRLDFISGEVVSRQYNQELYIHNFLYPVCLFLPEGVVPNNKEGPQEPRCLLLYLDDLNGFDFRLSDFFVVHAKSHNKNHNTIDIYVIKKYIFSS